MQSETQASHQKVGWPVMQPLGARLLGFVTFQALPFTARKLGIFRKIN